MPSLKCHKIKDIEEFLQHIHDSLKCQASTLHGKNTLKSLYIEVWSSTTMIFLCRHREEKRRKDNTPDSVGW